MSAVIDGRREAERLGALYKSPPRRGNAPITVGDRGVKGVAGERSPKANPSTIPAHWRDRLPAPVSFYANVLPDLSEPDEAGQAFAICPLHSGNTTAMVTINMISSRGCWNCPVCGKGDMVAFVMRLFNDGFVAAVRRLVLGVQQ